MAKKSKKDKSGNDTELGLVKKLINIELNTDAGKINYRFGILLIIFCSLFTSKDWITDTVVMILNAVSDKKIEYSSSPNIVILLLLIIVMFLMCILLLYITEVGKEKFLREAEAIRNEKKDDK